MQTGSRLLLSHRNTALLIEGAWIRADGDRIVYDKTVDQQTQVLNIPHVNLAALFMGEGSTITHSALRLLSEEGVHVVFVDTDTTTFPMGHYGNLTKNAVPSVVAKLCRIVTTPLALEAAKLMVSARLALVARVSDDVCRAVGRDAAPDAVKQLAVGAADQIHLASSHEKLMTADDRLTKAFSKAYAERLGLDGFERKHRVGEYGTLEGHMNARLDQGSALAYGIAGTVTEALGLPPSLSVFPGGNRSSGLVFDLAGCFRDAIVLPAAFGDFESDAAFRARLMEIFHEQKILKFCFETMNAVLDLGKDA